MALYLNGRKGGRPERYYDLRKAVQAMEPGDPPLVWSKDGLNIRSVRTLVRQWGTEEPRTHYRVLEFGVHVHIVRLD